MYSDSADLATHGDLLGMLFGKGGGPSLGQAARRRVGQQRGQGQGRESRAALVEEQADLEALRADLEEEVADLEDEYAAKLEIDEVEIPLEKADVGVVELKLVWIPTG